MNILSRSLGAGIGLIWLQAAAADQLPRLFFSPPERAAIVQLRSKVARLAPGAAIASSDTVAVAVAETNPPRPVQVAAPVLRLEGLSIASSGATFAWIGGQRYANGARVAGHRLEISAQGVVMVDAGGRSRRVRVGEALNGPERAAEAKP
jgi:hypothetical protein